jgi:hypothetical protein
LYLELDVTASKNLDKFLRASLEQFLSVNQMSIAQWESRVIVEDLIIGKPDEYQGIALNQ